MKLPSDVGSRVQSGRIFVYALEQILKLRTPNLSHTMGIGADNQQEKRIEECGSGVVAPWPVDEASALL
jgi:hypothetical protein